MITNVENKIKQTTEKTRTCPHCKEIIENITPLEFGRHVQHCPKRKTEKIVLPKHTISVCNIDEPDPQTPMKAIRLNCLDCCDGSSYEVEHCPATDCPLWTRRFGTSRETAHRRGKNVVRNEFE